MFVSASTDTTAQVTIEADEGSLGVVAFLPLHASYVYCNVCNVITLYHMKLNCTKSLIGRMIVVVLGCSIFSFVNISQVIG